MNLVEIAAKADEAAKLARSAYSAADLYDGDFGEDIAKAVEHLSTAVAELARSLHRAEQP